MKPEDLPSVTIDRQPEALAQTMGYIVGQVVSSFQPLYHS